MRYLKVLAVAAVLASGITVAYVGPDDHPAPTVTIPPAKSGATTSLPGVTIRRRTDPLSRSDRNVARLKKALPGADASVTPKKDVGDHINDYLAAHADPNSATGQQRVMMNSAEHSPPEAIPNDPSSADH